jgi:hypothetical protein
MHEMIDKHIVGEVSRKAADPSQARQGLVGCVSQNRACDVRKGQKVEAAVVDWNRGS